MRTLFSHIFLFLGSVALTGCFHHNYRAKPIELPCTDLRLNVDEALCSNSFCPGVYPSEAWWLFFEDEKLNDLITLSLAFHPDMKLAEARIRKACQIALEGRSALYPHLFLLGDVKRQKVSEFGSQAPGSPNLFTEVTLSVNATYELDLWHKNRNIYYAELDEMKAMIAEREEVQLLLSTAIAEAYFNLQCHLARLTIAEEKLETKQGVYTLLSQKYAKGVIDEFRLYETDSELAEIQDEVDQIQELISIDRNALAALVGNAVCDTTIPCVVPSANYYKPFPIPSTLPLDLLARRPDITAQIWRIEASCYEIKVAQARFLPNLDLLSYIGVQSFRLSELFTDRTMIILGEMTGLLPLFTAGKLRAQLGVARETLEIAIEEYNQTVLLAVQQVSDALVGLMTADKRKVDIERSLNDAERLFQLTQARYFNGIDAKLNLLNATENVLVQKDLETQIQLARFQAAVGVIRAIGGGYYARSCE